MKTRENNSIKRGSAEYEVIKRQVLDLYIITENASTCYELFRRAITGDDYRPNSANASSFFKKEDHVEYMDQRKAEIARWGFEQYSRMAGIDISELKQKEDKYYDIETLTPDELRTKNLSELEEIKNNTQDPKIKADVIKQQTDLMDAKRKEREEQSTEKYIHYYLPIGKCNDCPHKERLISKHTKDEGETA